MRWLDAALPVRMTRIALVAPAGSVRDMLVKVGEAGTVEIEAAPELAQAPRADRSPSASAGESLLRQYEASAVPAHGVGALLGWTPADQVSALGEVLARIGCAAVPLRRPDGVEPPTLVAGSAGRRALSPLVATYGVVPYADVNPAWLAWVSYVLMFGIMFGDAGDGLLLIAAGIAMRSRVPRRAARYRGAWPFVAGAGAAATLFGFAYGEFFGPTSVIPTLWLDPIARPIPLLIAGLGVGATLLAGAYALGMVNRWREGGWRAALYASSGIAGSALLLGIGVLAAGWYVHLVPALAAGATLAAVAVLLAFVGFLADAGGGGYGLMQACVEVFDLVVRLGSNVASFARLAAFGLAHAALGLLVWEGTSALWHRGGIMAALAVALMITGTALAFALEGLVAAVQALRLEYYELFSRIFLTQGRQFRPWRLRIDNDDAQPPGNDSGLATAGTSGAITGQEA